MPVFIVSFEKSIIRLIHHVIRIIFIQTFDHMLKNIVAKFVLLPEQESQTCIMKLYLCGEYGHDKKF